MSDERLYLRRNFLREEEFLSEFGHGGIVPAAIKALHPDEWHPDYNCNDSIRQQQDYSRKAGHLDQPVFESAAVYDSNGAFSSVQILLGTAKRIINIEVRKTANGYEGRKLVDQSRQ